MSGQRLGGSGEVPWVTSWKPGWLGETLYVSDQKLGGPGGVSWVTGWKPGWLGEKPWMPGRKLEGSWGVPWMTGQKLGELGVCLLNLVGLCTLSCCNTAGKRGR